MLAVTCPQLQKAVQKQESPFHIGDSINKTLYGVETKLEQNMMRWAVSSFIAYHGVVQAIYILRFLFDGNTTFGTLLLISPQCDASAFIFYSTVSSSIRRRILNVR